MLNRSDVSRAVDRPRSRASVRGFLRPMIVAWAAAGLVIGLVAQFSGWGHWASPIWSAATIPVLLALVAETVISLRRGDVGLDIVAALSMLAALVFAEYLAAVVVALMYAGGQYLEAFAERRASREMTALLARVPRTAESTYAGIVRLVEAAQRSRAPMSRLADRYAMVFLAATIALAGASWVWSADPIRAVAVLVVATPCPLILAVPVAIVSGLSRAAKHGILIKGGQALETLARVRSLVIDKTGTLTHGRAHIVATNVVSDVSADEILRLAASLDQASKHIMAQTIVDDARTKGLELAIPSNVIETPGEGIEGCVDGHHVIVGGLRFVSGKIGATSLSRLHTQRPPGSVAVAVAMDARLVGVLILVDRVRAGTEALLRDLKSLGLARIVLATGDRRDVAELVARSLPIDAVRWELSPDQKTLVVLSERKNGPVMMIGDGINDAPALAAADLGMAMGAKGAAASAEATDVVLLVDQLDRVLPAIKIARRSRFIALESVYAGLGLSVMGMIAAALGQITPVQGAIFQEVIDIAVILNALRALHDRSV